MAAMYENLCGNCVGGVQLTFYKRAFDFFVPTQLPRKCSYIVAILIHNDFESITQYI
jgi:hypothetical protein